MKKRVTLNSAIKKDDYKQVESSDDESETVRGYSRSKKTSKITKKATVPSISKNAKPSSSRSEKKTSLTEDNKKILKSKSKVTSEITISRNGRKLYVDPAEIMNLDLSKLCEEAETMLKIENEAKNISDKKPEYKVLFTGDNSEKLQKSLKQLEISLADSVETCTLLLTNKIKGSRKFICALVLGKPILDLSWLQDSIKAGKCLNNFDNYIIKDVGMEQKHKFSLRESLERAKKKKLLEGYTVVLTPNLEKSLLEHLFEIIQLSGGKTCVGAPKFAWPKKCFIVSALGDIENARKIAEKKPKIMVKTILFITISILKQELDFTTYNLNLN